MLLCRNESRLVAEVLMTSRSSIRGIGFVADKLDRPDISLVPFLDFEHQIDAAVRQLDDLGVDVDVETAGAAVDLDDALHVGLHCRTLQRAALLGLDFKLELLVLDAAVALEGNAVDDRILNQDDANAAARGVDAHVLEEPCTDKRFVGVIDLQGTKPAVRPRLEVGAYRAGLDPPVALDHDIRPGLGVGGAHRHDDGNKPENDPPEDQASHAQSPDKPDTHFHSQRAFSPNGR